MHTLNELQFDIFLQLPQQKASASGPLRWLSPRLECSPPETVHGLCIHLLRNHRSRPWPLTENHGCPFSPSPSRLFSIGLITHCLTRCLPAFLFTFLCPQLVSGLHDGRDFICFVHCCISSSGLHRSTPKTIQRVNELQKLNKFKGNHLFILVFILVIKNAN